MDRLTARAARELRGLPGVTQVGGHVGRAVTADQIVGVNSGELWVTIGSGADYGSDARVDQERHRRLPGPRQPRRGVLDRQGQGAASAGSGRRLVVRLYGEDLPVLRAHGRQLARKIGSVDGVTRARVVRQAAEPTIQVQVDLAEADRYGLKPGDVRRAAATLLSGTVVGSLFEKQQVFDVVVWGTPTVRQNLTSVREPLIDTPPGGTVRLSEVATCASRPSPPVIQRAGRLAPDRRLGRDVNGRDRGAVTHDIEQRPAGHDPAARVPRRGAG